MTGCYISSHTVQDMLLQQTLDFASIEHVLLQYRTRFYLTVNHRLMKYRTGKVFIVQDMLLTNSTSCFSNIHIFTLQYRTGNTFQNRSYRTGECVVVQRLVVNDRLFKVRIGFTGQKRLLKYKTGCWSTEQVV